ncbi:hypothetical protein ACFV1W_40210, partial [Kitasatospora sp. NPDC059648]
MPRGRSGDGLPAVRIPSHRVRSGTVRRVFDQPGQTVLRHIFHGTGTGPRMTAIKAMTGHTLGGSGLLSLVMAVLAMKEGTPGHRSDSNLLYRRPPAARSSSDHCRCALRRGDHVHWISPARHHAGRRALPTRPHRGGRADHGGRRHAGGRVRTAPGRNQAVRSGGVQQVRRPVEEVVGGTWRSVRVRDGPRTDR